MGDIVETTEGPARPRTTVPEDLRRAVHGRVSGTAGEALQRLASAPRDCPRCGAVGAIRSRFCECDAKLDPGAAAVLPPAAASPRRSA